MTIDELIKKYEEKYAEIKDDKEVNPYIGVIPSYQSELAKEILQDLKKLKEPTILGYPFKEVIKILNGISIERKTQINMTMDNLSILAEKMHEDFNKSLQKSYEKIYFKESDIE